MAWGDEDDNGWEDERVGYGENSTAHRWRHEWMFWVSVVFALAGILLLIGAVRPFSATDTLPVGPPPLPIQVDTAIKPRTVPKPSVNRAAMLNLEKCMNVFRGPCEGVEHTCPTCPRP